MPITTGSYPAALEGGSEPPAEKSAPAKTSEPKSSGSSYDAEFMRGMEEGYSPRKAMAAGIVKC